MRKRCQSSLGKIVMMMMRRRVNVERISISSPWRLAYSSRRDDKVIVKMVAILFRGGGPHPLLGGVGLPILIHMYVSCTVPFHLPV